MEKESNFSVAEELFDKPKPKGTQNEEVQSLIQDHKPSKLCSDILPIIFIFLLFINQGILTGYFQSVKTILSERGIPFRDLGHFSLITYPFAFKFLIAPILDTYYSSSFGKKKTYIVPCYLLLIVTLLVFGIEIDHLIESKNITAIVTFGITSVAMMAIHDVVLDGWTVKLLREENRAYAGFCQTAGIALGKLFGFNLFIWLNSTEVSNNYFWSSPRDYPIISHKTQLYIIVVLDTITMLIILLFINEESHEDEIRDESNIKATLAKMKGFWLNQNLKYLLIIMLFLKFGYITNNPGKDILMRKGFKREKVALVNLLGIPVGIISAFIGSFISKKKRDMTISYFLLWLRVFNEIGYYFIVSGYTRDSESYYIGFIIANSILDDLLMKVGDGATASFGFRIAEVGFGRTFLTMYFSTRNFAGDWAESITYYLMEVLDYWHLCVIGGIYQALFLIIIVKTYLGFERLSLEYWKPDYRHSE